VIEAERSLKRGSARRSTAVQRRSTTSSCIAAALASRDLPIAIVAGPVSAADLADPQ
jgi:hypothetical protein